MDSNNLTQENPLTILTVKEAAQYLHKSTSWLYKNWRMLGGVKLGGSLLFPSKGELHELIFGNKQGMEIRLHPERQQIHQKLVQEQKRGKASGSKTERGSIKSDTPDGSRSNPNRHGLLGACE